MRLTRHCVVAFDFLLNTLHGWCGKVQISNWLDILGLFWD